MAKKRNLDKVASKTKWLLLLKKSSLLRKVGKFQHRKKRHKERYNERNKDRLKDTQNDRQTERRTEIVKILKKLLIRIKDVKKSPNHFY